MYLTSYTVESISLQAKPTKAVMWLLFKSTFLNRSNWILLLCLQNLKTRTLKIFQLSTEKKSLPQMLINTFELVLKVNEFLSSRWDFPSINYKLILFSLSNSHKGYFPCNAAMLYFEMPSLWKEMNIRFRKKATVISGCDGLFCFFLIHILIAECWPLLPLMSSQRDFDLVVCVNRWEVDKAKFIAA